MKRFSKIWFALQILSLFMASPIYGKYFIVTDNGPAETAEDFYRSCVSNNSAINDNVEADCERQALQHPSLKQKSQEESSDSES